jgi:hypothetical protein
MGGQRHLSYVEHGFERELWRGIATVNHKPSASQKHLRAIEILPTSKYMPSDPWELLLSQRLLSRPLLNGECEIFASRILESPSIEKNV